MSAEHTTPSHEPGGGGGHDGQQAPGCTTAGPLGHAMPVQATLAHEHTGQHWPGGVTSCPSGQLGAAQSTLAHETVPPVDPEPPLAMAPPAPTDPALPALEVPALEVPALEVPALEVPALDDPAPPPVASSPLKADPPQAASAIKPIKDPSALRMPQRKANRVPAEVRGRSGRFPIARQSKLATARSGLGTGCATKPPTPTGSLR